MNKPIIKINGYRAEIASLTGRTVYYKLYDDFGDYVGMFPAAALRLAVAKDRQGVL